LLPFGPGSITLIIAGMQRFGPRTRLQLAGISLFAKRRWNHYNQMRYAYGIARNAKMQP
jgi:hypothetical protein